MKIKKIRIENFRSFQDETINLNSYSCLVGPNGAGKSTVLAALNVFFKESSYSLTDVSKLDAEDYFKKKTENPVKITLTFEVISAEAEVELSDYVRQGELVVTAKAIFDETAGFGQVKYFGQRWGMQEFRQFFDAHKARKSATELTDIYKALRTTFTDLPAPPRSKDGKAVALREYESSHPDKCTLIPSEDDFYGVNSTGKLAQFIQWVYVPAVKDATEEGREGRDTAFGKLIARTVRSRTNFSEELDDLKSSTEKKYQEILENNKTALDELSQSLQQRFESWAHGDVRLDMEWSSDPAKSVKLEEPIAGIKTGEGDFLGNLARMGHGLQRSYLLALLQELADSESPNAPTLLLGVEEPELYQHPPQARHLADIFGQMAKGNNQVLVTTHSPLFVSGDGFENTRLVRAPQNNTGSKVKTLTYKSLCDRIRTVSSQDRGLRLEGLVAKIHQALQPNIAEMFFVRVPVLVEGQEDVAYITSELHLSNQWSEYRHLGCHLIPVNGKSNLIKPLAIAKEFELPVFTIFDADGDTKRKDLRTGHKSDNKALISLLDVNYEPFPSENIIKKNHAIWKTNIGSVVKAEFGNHYNQVVESAHVHYAHEGGLKKNEFFIAEWLNIARKKGIASQTLQQLCAAILDFARTLRA